MTASVYTSIPYKYKISVSLCLQTNQNSAKQLDRFFMKFCVHIAQVEPGADLFEKKSIFWFYFLENQNIETLVPFGKRNWDNGFAES